MGYQRMSKWNAGRVKGMLRRRDKKIDIAQRMRCSLDTIERIAAGETFSVVPCHGETDLPPPSGSVTGAQLDEMMDFLKIARDYIKANEPKVALDAIEEVLVSLNYCTRVEHRPSRTDSPLKELMQCWKQRPQLV